MKSLKIFHMASMARSGETLVQRHMQAHSQVLVTHNLKKEDAGDELKLFKYLKRSPRLSISARSQRLYNFETEGKSVLFLKQGVWEHPFPFRGFVLARNPLAIFASLWTYDLKEKGGTPEENWKYNEERFVRWLRDIDPLLIPGFLDLAPEHQFALFYNRRMGALLKTGLPIIYYEELVTSPEEQLRKICAMMGLPFEESLLDAHSNYSEKDVGHGQIEMSRPIDSSSLGKYMNTLNSGQMQKLWQLTQEVAEDYGYYKNGERVCIQRTERAISLISQYAPKRSIDYYLAKGLRGVVAKARRLRNFALRKKPKGQPKTQNETDSFSRLPFAAETMRKLLKDYKFDTVLDVGAGAGAHSQFLIEHGKKVTSIDFGTSVYYEKRSENYELIKGDFLEYEFTEKFDCIWASHVLEHQPNTNVFIAKCISLLKDGGILAITVPPLKHQIVGGHLSLWNGGMLLYHLCFAGLDCSDASIRRYGYNVAIIVRKKLRPAVPLDYDSGDIDRLRDYLPSFCTEGFDGRIEKLNW